MPDTPIRPGDRVRLKPDWQGGWVGGRLKARVVVVREVTPGGWLVFDEDADYLYCPTAMERVEAE